MGSATIFCQAGIFDCLEEDMLQIVHAHSFEEEILVVVAIIIGVIVVVIVIVIVIVVVNFVECAANISHIVLLSVCLCV